jgi:hypothetical protein
MNMKYPRLDVSAEVVIVSGFDTGADGFDH